MRPKALVLLAPGTNRDRDLLEALELAGGEGAILPLAELSARKGTFADFGLLVVPGGFSYGDALGAGSLLALDLRKRFAGEVAAFAASGRPVLGICNGFQALVKAGLLPGADFQEPERTVTLTANEGGRFECRWVELVTAPSPSLWTEGLEEGLSCPVAHGEGRVAVLSPAVAERLRASGRIVLRYAGAGGRPAGGSWPANPNGSLDDIAGLCNAEGNVLGLMPHPENALRDRQVAGLPGRRSAGALRLFVNGLGGCGSGRGLGRRGKEN